MRKRIISGMLVMGIIIVLFSGCSSNDKTPETIAKEQASIILECLKTGETEEMKALFCDEVKGSHDLDKEIAEAREFIDGEIIDEGQWSGMSECGVSIRDGVKVKSDIHPIIKDVKTNSTQKYRIVFLTYLVYDGHNENLGITYITIKNSENNEDYYMIGEIIY